jgi:hypothetical protein
MVLGAWCLVLGAWCLVLGAWCLVLKFSRSKVRKPILIEERYFKINL